MISKTCTKVAVAVTMLFSSLSAPSAQTEPPNHEKLAAMRLENVRIEAQGIRQLFSRLALSYDIPIGIEIATNENEIAEYSLDLKDGSLSDLLTKFVTEHKEYRWEISGGAVNIVPNDGFRDAVLEQILDTEISRMSIRENTSCGEFERKVFSTPELRQILEATGMTSGDGHLSGPYIPQLGRHFSLDVSNMRLRTILNRVISESPVAKIWVGQRRISDRRLLIRLNARHEDSPKRRTEATSRF